MPKHAPCPMFSSVSSDDESQSHTLYPPLSPATHSTLKSTLLDSVGRESSKSISKKLCDTVSELAALVMPENDLLRETGALLIKDLCSTLTSKRKTREPKEENVTSGPSTKDGEIVFGVAHVFALFNDIFIHVTDLSGSETIIRIIEDVTPIPTGGTRRKDGRRGRRL